MIAVFCTLGALAAALPFFALFQLSGYRAVRDRKARENNPKLVELEDGPEADTEGEEQAE